MTEALSTLQVCRRNWLHAVVGLVLCAGARARAQEAKVLRVGFIANYEPFSFVGKDGRLTGFDVEVVGALLASLGMTLQVQVGRFEQLREQIKAGELDLLGNQLLQLPENRKVLDFVRPYTSIQLSCIQHEDDERDFLSLDDFVGKRLGVLRHSGMEEQARGALGPAVRAFDRTEQAMEALSQKKIDAVLEENLIADYLIDRHGWPLKVGAPMTAPQKVGLGVAKGRKPLQTLLSDGVGALVNEAAFKHISERWFGYDVSKPRFSHVSAQSK